MQVQERVQAVSDNPAAVAVGHDTAVAEGAAQYGRMLRVLGGPCAVPHSLPVPAVEVGPVPVPMETGRGLALQVPEAEPRRHSSGCLLHHWVRLAQTDRRRR